MSISFFVSFFLLFSDLHLERAFGVVVDSALSLSNRLGVIIPLRGIP
jgi:hypothetical protein